MRKIIFLTILFVSFSSLIAINTYAEPSLEEREDEVSEERSQLQEELSDAEQELADVVTELETLDQEIERLNDAIEKNEEKLEETKEEIQAKEEEAEKLEQEIAKIQERIDTRKDVLKNRLSSLQQNGGSVDYIEVVLGASSFGDFVSRVSTVNKVMDSDKKLVEQHIADQKELEEKELALKDRMSELESKKEEMVGMNELLETQKEETENKAQTLENKESELVALQEELQVEDSRLASIQNNIEQEIEEQNQAVALASQETSNNNSSNSSNNNSNNNSNDSSSNTNESNDSSNQSSSAPSGNGSMESVIQAGLSQQGTPYVWGGTSASGFDCSGFLTWAFRQGGLNVQGRSTSDFVHVGQRVSSSQMQRGDLVFFDTYKKNGHIGIYLGNGEFLGAQNSTGVAVASMNNSYWSSKFNGHVRRLQ
ncbi:C40 family peptidase [Alkalibacillus salilacus]|uniref:Peptidoglycan hydrolase CwlO-like protein n=1 Tax=Alkalibacillus salilacus TaxID=284582 RepID=A0ABT9VCW3_9BACI|nr:C40 family peptidase [Alkalibacillus salilacus]MDQ0158783.1 peptidoglycan hydrolase CwlO-like protein [Alkalibacillus salilacus]